MTRAEQCLLGGCHPGRRTMCRCECWSWRITLRWPTGSARACATPVSPSTWSTTARQPCRARPAPATTWSCSTGACRRLVRDGSPSRILMLTAAAGVEDRVDGLELGADDYLGKPFAFTELIARIRALGRRGPGSPAVVQRGNLIVDRARHRASRAGIPLALTRKEFGVLECLAGADGAAVSAEELLEHVWDAHADPFSNTVAVTVGRLRRKLGDPPLIETVAGVGYRL